MKAEGRSKWGTPIAGAVMLSSSNGSGHRTFNPVNVGSNPIDSTTLP